MCIDPGRLADGTEIACRICWQCRENKVNDWVGRCIAETKTATASFFWNVTYGPDIDKESPTYGEKGHFRSAWLTYSDVQKWFKSLRSDGYKFRYLVCGEYGHEKGRAHWHAMLFFYGKVPPHELTVDRRNAKRFHNNYWRYGHQVCMKATEYGARYVCKYINKDIGVEERQAHLAMSKKPPIGDMYFRLLARKYVNQGLAPQDMTYSFPECKTEKGLRRKFYMRDITAHNFIEYYKAAWKEVYGNKHHPYSAVIDEHDDKIAAKNVNNIRKEPKPRIPDLPIGAKRWYEGVSPITGFKGIYADDMWSIRYWLRKSDDGDYLWRSEEEMTEGKAQEWSAWREARTPGSIEQSEAERSAELIAWIRSALRGLSGSGSIPSRKG